MRFRMWVGHTVFNIGFWTFFWGAFEIAFTHPSVDPIWSGTFGFPIPHHYIVGMVMTYVGYLVITLSKDVREVILSRMNDLYNKTVKYEALILQLLEKREKDTEQQEQEQS
jgi:hypothetical protein